LEESEVELFLRYSDAPNRAQLTAIDVPLRVPSEHHLLFYFWSGCIFWEYGCCAVTGVHSFAAARFTLSTKTLISKKQFGTQGKKPAGGASAVEPWQASNS
jgi:hypothetical protein